MPKPFGSKRFNYFEDVRRRSARDAHLVEALSKAQGAAVSARLTYPKPDLGRLAEKLGVREIRRAPLSIQGHVVTEHGSLVVEISDALTPFRHRFTLAHELAHIAIGDRPSSVSYGRFESICDACADELLLPDQTIRDALFDREVDPRAALWSLSIASGLPPDYLYRRALRAGALAAAPTFWCRGESTTLIPLASLPPRDELQLSDVRLSESAGTSVARAIRSGSPTDGTIVLSEAGVQQGVFSATFWPLLDQESSVLVILSGRHRKIPNSTTE